MYLKFHFFNFNHTVLIIILVFKKYIERTECKISVNSKILAQMNEVVYVGSIFSREGGYEMDVERRIAAGNKVNEPLAALMRRRNVSTAARLAMQCCAISS